MALCATSTTLFHKTTGQIVGADSVEFGGLNLPVQTRKKENTSNNKKFSLT